MQTTSVATLLVADRQRKEIIKPQLEELKVSILHKGLWSPILVRRYADGLQLVAGERRLRAVTELHAEGHTFKYNNQPVPAGEIPFVDLGEMSAADILEAELEENILREDLTWLEAATARAKIHHLRLEANPAQTQAETARELSTLTRNTSTSEAVMLTRALVIHQHKDDSRVLKAKTEQEAYRAVLDATEDRFKRDLIRIENRAGTNHDVILGDCRTVMEGMPLNHFAAIITDPPYGINAHQMGKESDHYYEDTPEHALDTCKYIIRQGFRVCKPRAVLFMFCDIEHFVELRNYCSQQAWSPFRTPIIWAKGIDGRAPWGRAGFIRTHEYLLFAVKGQQELRYPGGPDVISIAPTKRSEQVHAAEKPRALLSQLVRLSCLPGEFVLDPCAGSGSIIPAANEHKVRAVCIESDETYHATACSRATNDDPPESDPKLNELDFLAAPATLT